MYEMPELQHSMAAAAGGLEAASESSASRTRCSLSTCLLFWHCTRPKSCTECGLEALCSVLVRVRPLPSNGEQQCCLEVKDEHLIRVQAEREHLFSFDEVLFAGFKTLA